MAGYSGIVTPTDMGQTDLTFEHLMLSQLRESGSNAVNWKGKRAAAYRVRDLDGTLYFAVGTDAIPPENKREIEEVAVVPYMTKASGKGQETFGDGLVYSFGCLSPNYEMTFAARCLDGSEVAISGYAPMENDRGWRVRSNPKVLTMLKRLFGKDFGNQFKVFYVCEIVSKDPFVTKTAWNHGTMNTIPWICDFFSENPAHPNERDDSVSLEFSEGVLDLRQGQHRGFKKDGYYNRRVCSLAAYKARYQDAEFKIPFHPTICQINRKGTTYALTGDVVAHNFDAPFLCKANQRWFCTKDDGKPLGWSWGKHASGEWGRQPESKVFVKFPCMGSEILHGRFLDGAVRWEPNPRDYLTEMGFNYLPDGKAKFAIVQLFVTDAIRLEGDLTDDERSQIDGKPMDKWPVSVRKRFHRPSITQIAADFVVRPNFVCEGVTSKLISACCHNVDRKHSEYKKAHGYFKEKYPINFDDMIDLEDGEGESGGDRVHVKIFDINDDLKPFSRKAHMGQTLRLAIFDPLKNKWLTTNDFHDIESLRHTIDISDGHLESLRFEKDGESIIHRMEKIGESPAFVMVKVASRFKKRLKGKWHVCDRSEYRHSQIFAPKKVVQVDYNEGTFTLLVIDDVPEKPAKEGGGYGPGTNDGDVGEKEGGKNGCDGPVKKDGTCGTGWQDRHPWFPVDFPSGHHRPSLNRNYALFSGWRKSYGSKLANRGKDVKKRIDQVAKSCRHAIQHMDARPIPMDALPEGVSQEDFASNQWDFAVNSVLREMLTYDPTIREMNSIIGKQQSRMDVQDD